VNAMMVIPSPLAAVVHHLLPVAVSTHLQAHLQDAMNVVIAIIAMMNVFNATKLMPTYAKELLINTKNANKF
jgi:hypothetical protein